MNFKEKTAERYFMTIKSPVIISDSKTNIILWMNEAAENELGNIIGKVAKEHYKMDNEGLKWYQALNKTNYSCNVYPMQADNGSEEILFESVFLEEEKNDRILRVDMFQPIMEERIDAISVRYDLVSKNQSWDGNDVIPIEDSINSFLNAALYIYAADRAFVIEIDKSLECVIDVFSQNRLGFSGEIESTRNTDSKGINCLEALWNEGKIMVLEAYNKNKQDELLKKQLYVGLDSWSSIIVPFSKPSGIRCFLCMDNPRRFKNYTSVARNIALLMTGYLYANEMRNNIDIARRLSAKVNHLPENRIKIYLFGGLKIRTNLGIQQDSSFFSSQCGTFFVYLLSNRRRIVPIRELTEVLWPDEIIDNPYNMIKNVAFRTRKMFDNVCPQPLIVAGNGTYCINKNLDIWLDTDEFEYLCRQAENETLDTNVRLSACKKALDLYTGCVLPNFDGETWLMTKISYFQILFSDLINIYVELLEEKKEYKEILNVISKASEREILDSHIYYVVLVALINCKNFRLAKQYYNKISKDMPKEDKDSFWKEYNDKKEKI